MILRINTFFAGVFVLAGARFVVDLLGPSITTIFAERTDEVSPRPWSFDLGLETLAVDVDVTMLVDEVTLRFFLASGTSSSVSDTSIGSIPAAPASEGV